MCFANDAKNWTGLSDIESVRLSEDGGSAEIKISPNGTATHIAICKVSGTNRYITYANDLSSSGEITQYINRVTCKDYGRVNIVGKNGNSWLIMVENNFANSVDVEYNTKMCHENDAKNWTALYDLTKITLARGESQIITIQENYFATHIAISFFKWNVQIYLLCK